MFDDFVPVCRDYSADKSNGLDPNGNKKYTLKGQFVSIQLLKIERR